MYTRYILDIDPSKQLWCADYLADNNPGHEVLPTRSLFTRSCDRFLRPKTSVGTGFFKNHAASRITI